MEMGTPERRCYSIAAEHSRKEGHGVHWARGTEHKGGILTVPMGAFGGPTDGVIGLGLGLLPCP